MGKYSNINVNSLINAVTKALNELNQYSLRDIKSDLTNPAIMTSSVVSGLNSNFQKVIESTTINGSIAQLRKKLNNLKNAATYIEKYQDTEEEIERLEEMLYRNDGTKNYSVQSRINSKRNALSNYEKKIDQYLS